MYPLELSRIPMAFQYVSLTLLGAIYQFGVWVFFWLVGWWRAVGFFLTISTRTCILVESPANGATSLYSKRLF